MTLSRLKKKKKHLIIGILTTIYFIVTKRNEI